MPLVQYVWTRAINAQGEVLSSLMLDLLKREMRGVVSSSTWGISVMAMIAVWMELRYSKRPQKICLHLRQHIPRISGFCFGGLVLVFCTLK
jgi:hypothetical protein